MDMETQNWNRLRKGDAAALAWIYDRNFKLLYNYGRKISGDPKLLEDAIHDLFVDLWRLRGNLSPTTSVRFYLYRSLRRRLARNKTGYDLEPGNHAAANYAETVPCEEQQIIEKETETWRVTRLKKLLGDLSPRQYEAMILRFYDELSFGEIGAILNVNEQSARNLVQRGLLQLKQYGKLLLTWSIFFTTCL